MRDMIELKAELDKLMCGLGGVLAAKLFRRWWRNHCPYFKRPDQNPKQLVRDINLRSWRLSIGNRLQADQCRPDQ